MVVLEQKTIGGFMTQWEYNDIQFDLRKMKKIVLWIDWVRKVGNVMQ